MTYSVLEQARKDVAQIFNHLLRRQIGTRLPTVEYLSSKPDVVLSALKGFVPKYHNSLLSRKYQLNPSLITDRYENAEVALNTGAILHEMLRHEALAKTLLYSDR